MTIILSLTLALAPLAASQKAPEAAKVDRVTLRAGAPIEGEVQKETYKDVTIKAGASVQTLPSPNVLKVEYWDAPPAFKGAMAAIEADKWSEALPALASAEDYANSKEKGVVKPRAWFPVHLAFYRGQCQLQLGQTDKAIQNFEKLRKDPAFKDNRFLAQAYELTLEAFREKGDTAKMEETEKEIDQAPGELKLTLQTLAKRQRAELLYDKNKYEESRRLFETITTSPDPAVAAAGTSGVIRSLSGMKDAAGLDAYCKKVLSTATQPSLLLIAANAQADAAFEKKDFPAARDFYIQSVVRYNPGRGAGVERDHERALYRLGQCYEALLEAAKDAKVKDAISAMASSTFRELSIEYPSGRFREEAAAKAVKYEPKEEKKEDKK
ncbi:MAG TPA: tetratricopeptide repeat protein [Planctomycetota bacterium]